MKLSTIVLYAVISPYLVGGDVTIDCEEWCEVDRNGAPRHNPKYDICVSNCGDRRLECQNLCNINSLKKKKVRKTCQDNCEYIDEAAKVLDLIKESRREIVKKFSQPAEAPAEAPFGTPPPAPFGTPPPAPFGTPPPANTRRRYLGDYVND